VNEITESGALRSLVEQRQIAVPCASLRVEADVLCAFQPRVLAPGQVAAASWMPWRLATRPQIAGTVSPPCSAAART
jgi:hypothetical protein